MKSDKTQGINFTFCSNNNNNLMVTIGEKDI